MSTDLTTYEPQAVARSIAATANALVDAHKIGTALCRTAFVPKHFQGKPDDAAAAILYGATIDMDPVTALQNVYVIGGKPALYARTMVAIALSRGHEVWTEEETEGSVTVAGRRKGSDKVERVTWTTVMAKRAGYDSNAKYRSDPRSMLYARASGDVARRIAPDALLGMAYNVEELQIADEPARQPKPAGSAALRAAVAPEPEPAPDTIDAEVVEAVEEERTDTQPVERPEPDPSGPMLAKTRARLFATFGERGIDDRDEQIRGMVAIIGRPIESRADLTEDEALQVLARLKGGK